MLLQGGHKQVVIVEAAGQQHILGLWWVGGWVGGWGDRRGMTGGHDRRWPGMSGHLLSLMPPHTPPLTPPPLVEYVLLSAGKHVRPPPHTHTDLCSAATL